MCYDNEVEYFLDFIYFLTPTKLFPSCTRKKQQEGSGRRAEKT